MSGMHAAPHIYNDINYLNNNTDRQMHSISKLHADITIAVNENNYSKTSAHILNTYEKNNLLYIGFDGKIIKSGTKKKIKGKYPSYSKIKIQEKYNTTFYALLSGREFKTGQYLILIDIDNKSDDNTINGLEFVKIFPEFFDENTVPLQHTPSKGFHFLFWISFDQLKLLNKSYTTLLFNDLIYNVDIKLNNQLINCEPSVIPGYGKYEWANSHLLSDIPKLPDILYNIILLNTSNNTHTINTMSIKSFYPPMATLFDITSNKASQHYNSDIKLLLSCISSYRLHDYRLWLNLGIILYSLNQPFDLWNDLSKCNDKYDYYSCLSKWKSFKFRKTSIGSLFSFAKTDNPGLFSDIKSKLISINDTLNDDNDYISKSIDSKYLDINHNAFSQFVDHNAHSLVIKSDYGSGKTTIVHDFIKQNPQYKRVLFICSRVTLCQDIYHKFSDLGFETYENYYNDNSVYSSDKLIVQLDSLYNIYHCNDNIIINGQFNDFYDLIVIDEIESILYHFNSDTMINKSKCTFNFMKILLSNSTKNIFLDGDISSRSLSFVSNINDGKTNNKTNNYIYVKNNYKSQSQKHFQLYSDEPDFNDLLYSNISPGCKIGIVSQSLVKIQDYEKDLKIRFPYLNILSIHHFTGSKEKKLILSDINKYIINNNINILLYSPTVECGVDITVQFDKIFGIVVDNSNSQRSFLQMLNRFRNISDLSIPISNTSFSINNNYNFWTYIETKLLYDSNNKNYNHDFIINDNGSITQQKTEHDDYYINCIFNRCEDLNKDKSIYINFLKTLCINKGYTFEFINDKLIQPKKNVSSIKIDNILNAFDITPDQHDKMNNMKKIGDTTTDDNYAIEKYFYKQLLCVTDLTEDLLKTYHNKSYLIDNFMSLVDIRNIKLSKDNSLRDDNIKYKLDFINDAFKYLGFKHVLDTIYVESDTFNDRFDTMFEKNLINPKKLIEIFLLTKKKEKDIKPGLGSRNVLGLLNTCLKEFSVKIISKQKISRKNTSEYTCKPLDNILEIVKNKIKIKQCNPYDKDGILVDICV